MRLAVFTNQFPGPVCTFLARDMRGLIDAGIDVDLFAIYPLDAELWRYVPDILNDKVLPRSKVHHLTFTESLRVVKSSASRVARFLGDTISISTSAIRHGREPFLKSSYLFLKAWTWAHQYGNKYDHVLAYWGNHAGTCAYLFHRLCEANIPFSLFLHASIDLYQESIYLREKLRYANKIITCSDFNRQFIFTNFADLDTSLPEKIYVHYHGLNVAQLASRSNGRSPGKVVAVGRFTKQKGFDYLLRAFRELKNRRINGHLELIGDGEEAKSLNSLAAKLDLLDTVTFRGWLPSDDVPYAIGQATVLVHPSPDLGDGVPNVIKEAMAVGTPVIGSRVAGIPELLEGGKCGMLVPPKDIEELANAIQVMLTNKSLRRQYSDAARKRAEEKFDLWKNGQNLASVLLSART